ncbi:MAG TPA: biopolymer transporter ExbD [Methylomirabilota bacterium]|nr:biopolymer transporter ExbD [Methylomirabilota bacterium]
MAIRVNEGIEGGGNGYRVSSTMSEINIIPLVDVILVLLLIFMLTAPLMYRGIDVNLPKTGGRPTAVEERVVLTVTKEQTVFLNDKPVAFASLEQVLVDMFKNRQDKTMYLRADQGLQYGFVIEIMDRVRRAGIEKLGMVTEPTRPR